MQTLAARRRAVWFEVEQESPARMFPDGKPYTPPAAVLYCECGQAVTIGERYIGHALMPTFMVDGREVRVCPNCGYAYNLDRLLHWQPFPAKSEYRGLRRAIDIHDLP